MIGLKGDGEKVGMKRLIKPEDKRPSTISRKIDESAKYLRMGEDDEQDVQSPASFSGGLWKYTAVMSTIHIQIPTSPVAARAINP